MVIRAAAPSLLAWREKTRTGLRVRRAMISRVRRDGRDFPVSIR